MNEREEFLQYFRSAFVKLVEQLDTMTESEVLDGLLKVRAARSVYKEYLAEGISTMKARPLQRLPVAWPSQDTNEALVYLGSELAFSNSVNKLRTRAGAKAPPGRRHPFGHLEDALNDRLELLRKLPGGNI
jgi:hypothetical protein